MICVNNLDKTYYGKGVETQVLKKFNMKIEQGEFVCILGKSGCGKTTLLNILGLLDNPTNGKYELDGVDVTGLNKSALAKLRNSKLGFIFQEYHLIPELNVLENVCVPLGYAGVRKREREKISLKLLEELDLSEKAKKYPSQLSGGEKQRVAIARAISNNPSIILADEPTGSLDQKNGAIVMEILKGLHKRGVSIIMVTHDISLSKYSTQVIQIADGQNK